MKTLSVTVSDERLANEDAPSLPCVSEIDQLKSKLKTIKYFGEYRGRFNDLQKDVTKDAFVISETFLSDIQMTTIFEKHLFVAESLRTARGQWGIYTRKLIKQNTILGVYYGKIFTMSQKRENDRELSYPLAVGFRIQGNGHKKNVLLSGAVGNPHASLISPTQAAGRRDTLSSPTRSLQGRVSQPHGQWSRKRAPLLPRGGR